MEVLDAVYKAAKGNNVLLLCDNLSDVKDSIIECMNIVSSSQTLPRGRMMFEDRVFKFHIVGSVRFALSTEAEKMKGLEFSHLYTRCSSVPDEIKCLIKPRR